jgi:polysaccharide biosynthesis/export protein
MSMFRSASRALTLGLVLAAVPLCAAQEEKTAPKELVQYVKDAQKAGLKVGQIRQNAVKAGWPEEMVDNALDSPRANSKQADTPPESVKAVEKDPSPVSNAPVDPPAVQPGNTMLAKQPAPKAVEPEETATPKPAESKAPEAVATPKLPAPAEPAPSGKSRPEAEVLRAKALAASGVRSDDYVIGEGDVLQIVVWGERDASVPSMTVRTDGKITMPLIKEVQVAGLTPAQAEAIIQEQLSKVIKTADVTVIVSQINSKKIYLTGAVKREGPLRYSYRMTVLQAISEAGGLTDYAKRKKIYILHNENGREYKLPFDYAAVLRGEHTEQNILLSPGDHIVVP